MHALLTRQPLAGRGQSAHGCTKAQRPPVPPALSQPWRLSIWLAHTGPARRSLGASMQACSTTARDHVPCPRDPMTNVPSSLQNFRYHGGLCHVPGSSRNCGRWVAHGIVGPPRQALRFGSELGNPQMHLWWGWQHGVVGCQSSSCMPPCLTAALAPCPACPAEVDDSAKFDIK